MKIKIHASDDSRQVWCHFSHNALRKPYHLLGFDLDNEKWPSASVFDNFQLCNEVVLCKHFDTYNSDEQLLGFSILYPLART